MVIHRMTRTAVTFCAAAIVAACSSAQTPLAQTGIIPSSVGESTALPAAQSSSGESWMSPAAASTRELLYISDPGTNAVLVYDYRTGHQVGDLTGFADPSGQCVDKAGDVWIANAGAQALVEYAHGAVTPLRALHTHGYPVGCSVAPDGDVAAASDAGRTARSSSIAVWGPHSVDPANYSNANCGTLSAPGYDDHNNLYVECQIADLTFIYELRAGGGALQKVPFDKTIFYPGGVMWDGQFLTLTDQNADFHGKTAIYRARESATGGLSVAGTTLLNEACEEGQTEVRQPFIVGNENTPANTQEGTVVIGANHDCGGGFDYWGYPAGNPLKKLGGAPRFAAGESVSIE
jgi:hypothetical protein